MRERDYRLDLLGMLSSCLWTMNDTNPVCKFFKKQQRLRAQANYTAHGQGKSHDFRLFKNSKILLSKSIEWLVDKGYQGILVSFFEPSGIMAPSRKALLSSKMLTLASFRFAPVR